LLNLVVIIVDMLPAPAAGLFTDMKGMLLPIGVAAFVGVTWPLLKLLGGVVAMCRCWSRWPRGCAVFTSIYSPNFPTS